MTTDLPVLAPWPVEQRDYVDAMARLGAAVNVITTDGPGGRAGFTASAVCSITDTPPTLLVCLRRAASVYAAVRRNKVLCVNVLSDAHREVSRLFGGKTPVEERFAAAAWRAGGTGAPMLDGAVAAFDCRVVRTVAVGTHDILIAEVLGVVRSEEATPLIYADRSYHALGARPSRLDPA